MAVNISKLIEALPVDDDDAAAKSRQTLEALLHEISGKEVPVGRLSRMWIFGTLQAKLAAAYLAYWIRSGYCTQSERERLLNETHLKAAFKLLGSMSYLRGIAMKIGQTLASYPNVVPKEFVATLASLHFEAPPMHYTLVQEQLRAALGDDPRNVFRRFEEEAFAAASLGQVHRATLMDGTPVAVKVQYPGIAKTVESDFKNFMALMTPMRLHRDWDNLRTQWEDMRKMVSLETDYKREADFMRRARAVFEPQDDIVVPRVYDHLSGPHVLTMDYLDGVHLDAFLQAEPSQEERDRFARLILRSSFRLVHTANFWYADPHPGNYVFMKDGRLGLLDFGCCREFDERETRYYNGVAKATQQTDDAEIRKLMVEAVGADSEEELGDEYMAFLIRYSRWHDNYLQTEDPFDFGDEKEFQKGIDMIKEIAESKYVRSIPVNTWINRTLYGQRALLYRLQAKVAVRPIAREESDLWD